MQRRWFIAPRLDRAQQIDMTDPDNPVLVAEEYRGPGTGSPLAPCILPRMVCRAYSADAGTVLVGLMPGVSAPSDWTPQTVDEARSHFLSIMGFPAKPEEIE